jgi:leader peptidase (prepilin peptidase)/N-methyltransferase
VVTFGSVPFVTALVVAFSAVLGLVIGSFLNVVIWRVPRNESVVSPPSHCPRCDAPIRPRDNVPVLSWLLLRGKCRKCGEPISGRYPAVEMLTCAVFAAMAARLGADWAVPAFLYLAAVGIALALIDLDTKKLPDKLTLPSYAVGVVLLGAAALLEGEVWLLLRALIGMAALYAFYFLLALIYPKGMGFGDVKLAGVLGLHLGYLGWSSLVVGGALGFFLGGVFGAVAMAVGRATRKSMVPYGPFMILGAFLAVWWGEAIADAYLGATGIS